MYLQADNHSPTLNQLAIESRSRSSSLCRQFGGSIIKIGGVPWERYDRLIRVLIMTMKRVLNLAKSQPHACFNHRLMHSLQCGLSGSQQKAASVMPPVWGSTTEIGGVPWERCNGGVCRPPAVGLLPLDTLLDLCRLMAQWLLTSDSHIVVRHQIGRAHV